MHTKPVESCTCFQCEWARVNSVAQSPWENAQRIRRTSILENFMSRRKDDSQAETALSSSRCAAALEAARSAYYFQPTTTPQESAVKDILDGPPATTSSSTSAKQYLPSGAAERKRIPLYSGLVKYFPDALVAVASLSYIGNQQHNPGAKLHWDRTKSQDQEDTLLRHLFEAGTVDSDGVRHSTKVAWRALALLQLELENAKR